MADESHEHIDPRLRTAQHAAHEIETSGFDDAGGKSADIHVREIVEGLSGDDESVQEAKESIAWHTHAWVHTKSGAGTSGAVLSRLLAIGIIDEFPEAESDVINMQDIPQRREWVLGHLMSKLNGTEESDEIAKAARYIKSDTAGAFIGRYAGEFCGYVLGDTETDIPVDILTPKLRQFVHGDIRINADSAHKGLEAKLLDSLETWALQHGLSGVWIEYAVTDEISAHEYSTIGFRPVGVYTDERGIGKIIASKRITHV